MAEHQSTLQFSDEQSALKSGIYQIRCIPTGKLYVGSAINLDVRWRGHRNGLRRGDHHSTHLQRAWNKYGEDAFVFEIIERVEPALLIVREQFHIDALLATDQRFGFNICGIAGSTLGVPLSDDAKKKLSIAHTGKHKPFVSEANRSRVHTAETRAKRAESGRKRYEDQAEREKAAAKSREALSRPEVQEKMSKAQLGRTHTEETRAKMSVAQKGRTFSAETIEKMREARKGWVFTPEHRQALSEAQRSRVHTEETRAKISAANKGMVSNNKGKKFSEETKAKMRAAWVRRKLREQCQTSK